MVVESSEPNSVNKAMSHLVTRLLIWVILVRNNFLQLLGCGSLASDQQVVKKPFWPDLCNLPAWASQSLFQKKGHNGHPQSVLAIKTTSIANWLKKVLYKTSLPTILSKDSLLMSAPNEPHGGFIIQMNAISMLIQCMYNHECENGVAGNPPWTVYIEYTFTYTRYRKLYVHSGKFSRVNFVSTSLNWTPVCWTMLSLAVASRLCQGS